jgi:hypothetical protein
VPGTTINIIFSMSAGGIRCMKNVTIHNAAILSISAGEHWLGIGAADNSMSLFHRPQERLGSFSSTGSKMAGWQLYRTPPRTVAVVCAVCLSFLLVLFLLDPSFRGRRHTEVLSYYFDISVLTNFSISN